MREARFNKPLTVALDPIIYDRVKAITDRQKRSMADWVRSAVERALEKQGSSTKEVTTNEHRA